MDDPNLDREPTPEQQRAHDAYMRRLRTRVLGEQR